MLGLLMLLVGAAAFYYTKTKADQAAYASSTRFKRSTSVQNSGRRKYKTFFRKVCFAPHASQTLETSLGPRITWPWRRRKKMSQEFFSELNLKNLKFSGKSNICFGSPKLLIFDPVKKL